MVYKIWLRTRVYSAAYTLLWCGFAVGTLCAQQQPSEPEKLAYGVDSANVPDAIAKVKSGEFDVVHVDLIARANATEAIPILKEQFNHIDDQTLKAKIAAALVRMGEKNNTYWDFLVEFAKPALKSDLPDYNGYDQDGKAVPGPSPEFQAWTRSHRDSGVAEVEDSVRASSSGILFLGWSRDKRAIPLLRRALSSPNHMIEIFAAMGLVEIGDKESIPYIIEACKRAPAEPAASMAESLVYFEDNAAQTAVDLFVPVDRAKLIRQAKANGKKSPLTVPVRSSSANQ
jgi:HEAT repeats